MANKLKPMYRFTSWRMTDVGQRRPRLRHGAFEAVKRSDIQERLKVLFFILLA